jgi:hypothetical protein
MQKTNFFKDLVNKQTLKRKEKEKNMARAKKESEMKGTFSILFKDSPEYVSIENARLLVESGLVRFMVFDDEDNFIEDIWFPLINIFRIQRNVKDIK